MNVDLPITHGSTTESASEESLRVRKRKLEDAFHTLDNAVQGPPADRPSAPKKTYIPRSLYSTLAKYGIKNKEQQAPDPAIPTLFRSNTAPELGEAAKKTPHLTAILSRAATRTKNAFSFKFPSNSSAPLLKPGAEYRPSSLQSFLSRLETFKFTTYANKPPCLDAVAASSASWVVAGREGMARDVANALLEKQRQGLVDNHKNGCPWRTRQCDPGIYCIPLTSPSNTVKEVKSNALVLNPLMEGVVIKHPLTPNQLNSLKKTVASYRLPPTNDSKDPEKEKDAEKPSSPPPANDDAMDVDEPPSAEQRPQAQEPEPEPEPELSEAAIVASLFGWSFVPPAPPPLIDPRLRRSSTTIGVKSASAGLNLTPSRPLLSRPGTPAGTPSRPTSRPSTPSLSHRSPMPLSRLASPAPDGENRARTPFRFQTPSLSLSNKRENTLLQCNLCQRRLGLWAFTSSKDETSKTGEDTSNGPPSSPTTSPSSRLTRPGRTMPQRQFDLLKEHRSYCPYVVKSTVVPTLPSFDPKAPSSGSRASSDRPAANPGLSRSLSTLHNPNAAMEGWRAVLTVLLRYGLAQRQRQEYDVFGRATANDGDASANGEDGQQEMNNVKAMVAGVKQRGGRDLLKYVKGLLG
ncbi:hypothetical protein CC1G_07575 [Coprinopsis cinerea okayama7|uniref:Zf-C3HC-domain-containing protein n=1 Tax=Coprinopsis cinerea (strain Okayama-7 / 130 / ATCC MYA-4618 / FGSC 9003) TaxID=240176 RepID=A8NUN1_COPC7|nr:hypothetical protein CC1G_07575 [Coprinopsis cinerea okayama7\|eukprot:XP_001836492.1 hypothetical protein CC1G_07575 [Coprinopsis cinerea okayama7\